jgi:hypothetical protein
VDALTFGLLLACAAGLGYAVLALLSVPREPGIESVAMSAAAGLGLLAIVLGVLALAGELRWADWLVPVGGIFTLIVAGIRRNWSDPRFGRLSLATWGLVVMVAGAGLGAIAPVTESDSLAYPLPIAMRLATTGTWRFWPDMARSVYPLSQELLAASLLRMGNARIGLLSAAELVIAAALIASLARRISTQRDNAWQAVVVALGCPAVAFLAASVKEDLLLVVMTVAAALALSFPPALSAAAGAGLFAGLAAGAKYTGVPVALAVVACVPICSGRNRPALSAAVAFVVALAAGGLWYGVNQARFGNPVVPLFPSIGHFPISDAAAADWLRGFGYGRTPLDFLLAPLRMIRDLVMFKPGEFGGRSNWLNPIIWLGIPGALIGRRRAMFPLCVISFALYVTWFEGFQVARLLLPAAALLSIPAADLLGQAQQQFRWVRYPVVLVLGVSVAVVAAVGLLRVGQYAQDPGRFVERQTEHFAAIQWMNERLDPQFDRVATLARSSGYLQIPWMNLAPDYQVEIPADTLDDPDRLLEALREHGFTYLFGRPEDFESLHDVLNPVYINRTSRLGGTRFFRTAPSDSVVVYEIPQD